MPRSFSSFSRSGSVPVRARTSALLPWSMWPAVPTMNERSGAQPSRVDTPKTDSAVLCRRAARARRASFSARAMKE
jgi:hypothetical protein